MSEIDEETLDIPLQLACQHGQLETVQWLISTFKLTVDDVYDSSALVSAIVYGRHAVVKWLISTFGPTMDANTAEIRFHGCCCGGHLETASYLAGQFGVDCLDGWA